MNGHAMEGIQEGPILMEHSVLPFQYSSKVSSVTSASSPSVVSKPPDSTLLQNRSVIITTKLQPGITVSSDTFTPPSPKHRLFSEDKQWHELRTDYSKLAHHYLMLSKIRLTCKYNNFLYCFVNKSR
jgi:hypothetical protein